MTSKNETYGYRGWLYSDSFLKRAFAVLGYSLVAQLILAIPIYAVVLVILIVLN